MAVVCQDNALQIWIQVMESCHLNHLMGCCHAGLPIGLQLIGRPWAEADLLFAGSVVEQARQADIAMPKQYHNPLSKH